MILWTLKRIAQSVPVFFIIVSLSFLLIRLAPGSPFSAERKLDPAVEAQLMQKYQLDGSLWEQFLRYWANLLRGDLGDSLKYPGRSVVEIIGQTLPHSLTIGLISFALAMSMGIVLGSFAAVFHGTWRDRSAMALALMGICLPTFVIAPTLAMVFGLWLPLFPVAGWGTLAHYVLPILCLSLPYTAYCSRLMRASMLEVLNQDYIRTARAKGLAQPVVLFKHALRVAILPVVNYAGPIAAHVLTGSLVIEEIFKIPGLGPFFINSVLNRDVFLAGGAIMTYACLLITFNIIVDIVAAWLDRRIRLS